MKALIVFGLILLSHHSTTARAQDMRLHPAQKGRIILDNGCTPDSKPEWTNEVLKASGGLKKGDAVLVFTRDKMVPATLGDLVCFIGECKRNYLSIEVGMDDVLGAISGVDGAHLAARPVVVKDVDTRQCEGIFAGITLKEFSTFQFPEVGDKRSCRRVVSDGMDLLLGTKGFDQGNGWPLYILKGQSRRGKTSPVITVDKDTNPLEPLFSLIDRNKKKWILWRKESGICCPSEITLRLSQMSKGELIFGPAYQAGGQPCD